MAQNNNNNNNDGNGNAHTAVRVFQVLTLIPAWAILAAVMGDYGNTNAKTPGEIQFLFVVTLLASVWAFCILITYLRAKNTALWMTFFDVVAMALLIASVVVISDIANAECVAVEVDRVTNTQTPNNSNTNDNWNPDQKWWNTKRLAKRVEDDGVYTYRQHCGNIRAAWGLAIANIILFLISAILTVVIYKGNQGNQQPVIREKIIVEHSPPPVMHTTHPSVVPPPPPPVFQDPYYGPPRRHSKDHRSHRSHRSSHGSHSRRSSHPTASYYEGSRRNSQGPDYYV